MTTEKLGILILLLAYLSKEIEMDVNNGIRRSATMKLLHIE
jgi:hypothetical protein